MVLGLISANPHNSGRTASTLGLRAVSGWDKHGTLETPSAII